MGSIFKKYPDFVLTGLALLFMAILTTSFIWGIQTIITSLNQAIGFNSSEDQAKAGFDLEGAEALDLKELAE